MYFLNVITQIYGILSRDEKTRLLVLQVFFSVSAAVQLVGIASIAPFIGVISDPDSIQRNRIYAEVYRVGNFDSANSFIIGFAMTSILMILLSNVVSALTLWLQIRFSVKFGSNLQSRLYSSFLSKDYLFHKTHNYTALISIISNDAPRFIYMVLLPYLLICSQIFVAVVIMSGLLFLNPLVALASAAVVGGSYVLTYRLVKSSLSFHGKVVTDRNRKVSSLLSESFIGIKDIKLGALERKYTTSYDIAAKNGFVSTAYIALAGDLPRFAIETISFSAILVFAVFLVSSSSGSDQVVSMLSIYALAGYKLLPTMQQIYKSVSSISANGGVCTQLKEGLHGLDPIPPAGQVSPMKGIKSISLKNVTFRYPAATTDALDSVSIEFRRGELNTVAGPSGSGKSTLADVMLGLLSPDSGSLNINDQEIKECNLASYQRCIGYVPQQIFILDDDVIANVAFGVDRDQVDPLKVTRALELANALDFVEKLPLGIRQGLGQDGKALSGGQRQRIGIARALYRNSEIMILDEPTSALDIDAEHDLMSLLNTLKNQVLIVVISHRPAAIKLSDSIAIVSDGRVVASGTYKDLFEANSYFRALIQRGFINSQS
jgi:ABC-type bacteriocin/lantibiotic exporter with double-glycine peptidase domain